MKSNKKLPPQINFLLNFLEENHETKLLHQEISDYFEDGIFIFKSSKFYIRFLQDRGDWFIEISLNEASNEWYDVALIREYISKVQNRDVLTLDEQVEYLMNNWDSILKALNKENFETISKQMRNIKSLRIKRRLGI